ncbi:MAG: hypothetical protein ACOYOU_14055 [Kiritimatiellia bacterium]
MSSACVKLGLVMLALAGSVFASTGAPPAEAYQAQAIDRYLSIISRQPFGLPPPPPPPPPAPPPSQAVVADPGKSFVLFEIVRTPAGDVVVGFTDNSAKPPRSLLLAVGEEADSYKVVSADLDSETAALEKDGVGFTLRMNSSMRMPTASALFSGAVIPPGVVRQAAPAEGAGGGTMSMADFAGRMARQNPEATPRKTPGFAAAERPVPNSVGGIDSLLGAGVQDNSYATRLRERRAQLVKQAAEDQARREQDAQSKAHTAATGEVKTRLREANLNLIRKGLKPIGSIELTAEEDAKLVAEGVLPAR